MVTKRFLVFLSFVAIALSVVAFPGASDAGKPTIATLCKQCHQPADDLVRGSLVSVSEKFKTIQVAVGNVVWVINYGDDIKVSGAEKLAGIQKDKEVGVRFSGTEKSPQAVSISVKPPAKVADEKLVSVEEMAKLTDMGPANGNYVLIDSRPVPRYNEGHIPHALSMPLDKFDELKEKILPKEKDKLVIFYCGGVT